MLPPGRAAPSPNRAGDAPTARFARFVCFVVGARKDT
jgi:hypothetical protein